MYAQLRHDWVARFTTLPPENRPRAKSGVSSITASSLPMGWALQKPRAGGTRSMTNCRGSWVEVVGVGVGKSRGCG